MAKRRKKTTKSAKISDNSSTAPETRKSKPQSATVKKRKQSSPSVQTMRGRERARLEKERAELQRNYQNLRRKLREAGDTTEIESLRGATDKKRLRDLEEAGLGYREIKDQLSAIRQELERVREVSRNRSLYITHEIDIHRPGVDAIQSAEEAGAYQGPLQYRVKASVEKELEETVSKVNQEIENIRGLPVSTDVLKYNLPPKLNVEEIKEGLTDTDSYIREIERLQSAYLQDEQWFRFEQTGASDLITRGERRYLQSRIDEENKRREEARKHMEEQKQRGFFMTQPEFATKPIDTSEYDKLRFRRMADVYTDAASARRAAIWKENYIKSIDGIMKAVLTKTYTDEEKDQIFKAAQLLKDTIGGMYSVEDIRRVSLYGPSIDIYVGNYAQIPSAIAHIQNALISLRRMNYVDRSSYYAIFPRKKDLRGMAEEYPDEEL